MLLCKLRQIVSHQFGRTYTTTSLHSHDNVYDVIMAGGGVIGLCCAYFLAKRMDPSKICVIERDASYASNSAVLSWGSIRQQFSIAENIKMSQFGFDFLQNVDEHLGVDGDTADIQFKHGTYCFLATAAGIEQLKANTKVQRDNGVPVTLLGKNGLALKYPWLNMDDIESGSDVSYGEGWFDPWSFLVHLRKKVCHMGVNFIKGEVKDVCKENNIIKDVKVTPVDGTNMQTMHCGSFVNASGAWAGTVGQMIDIGIPVQPAKRVTYVVQCPDGFSDPVLLIDGSQSIYLRPEGHQQFIVAHSATCDQEEYEENFDVDYDYFEREIWPKLAYRIPAFEKLKVVSAWAGLYDYNTVDQNGIICRYPEIKNLFLANGFSGHGIQQAPAVGRAITELIIDGSFQTIDLTRYSYDRFHRDELIIEKNIV